MSEPQGGILAPVPRLARYLTFRSAPDVDPRPAIKALGAIVDGERIVAGFGMSLVLALGRRVEGLRAFPSLAHDGIDVPSTPAALWCWLRGDDRGELVHRTRLVRKTLAPAFTDKETIDAFQYGASLDLTGYEDGTENPQGETAVEVAIVGERGDGPNGSSFVAVQTWVHDLDRFESMKPTERDHVFGRRLSDNEEIDDAPESAHVKRTAQESFDPEAFVVRRSMPWADEQREGLVFVAFGNSFDPFEALLNRMVGAEDGISDALFRFTRPVSGSYFWCPPVTGGRLDLESLGL